MVKAYFYALLIGDLLDQWLLYEFIIIKFRMKNEQLVMIRQPGMFELPRADPDPVGGVHHGRLQGGHLNSLYG